MTSNEANIESPIDPLRQEAIKRIKAKSEFLQFLGVWLGVAVIVNLVWLLSGANENYWPVWPMLGMGIAAFFLGLNAYGPGKAVLSEDKITAEMNRLAGK